MTFLKFQRRSRFYRARPSENGIGVDKELYEIADKRRLLACRPIFKWRILTLSFRSYRRSPLFPVSVVSRKRVCLCQISNQDYQVKKLFLVEQKVSVARQFQFAFSSSRVFPKKVSERLVNRESSRGFQIRFRYLVWSSDRYLSMLVQFVIAFVNFSALGRVLIGDLRHVLIMWSWFDQSRLEI